MQFKQYTDVHEFYRDTYNILMQDEAKNMILLGNIIIGNKGEDKTGWRDPAKWVMATAYNTNGIQLIALMTPPHNITLYAAGNRVDHQAIHCLADGLAGYDIPGVTSENSLAELFAKEYTARRGLAFKTSMSQRIYELTAVNTDVKQLGIVRLLEQKDMHYFPYWLEAFHAAGIYGNTKMSIPQDTEEYRYRISSKKLYVLEVDGIPVSMAGFTREMQKAIGVAFVYTPPYYRGKGYASSCVAQISQIALEKGFTKCVLYTDLLNPTSNRIYQRIGYHAVCDSLMLRFEG